LAILCVKSTRAGSLRDLIRRETAATTKRRQTSRIDSLSVALRARLLATFGVPLPDADAQERSPWREIIKTDWPERFSAATLQAQQQF
jgi:hypothetical protein